MPVLIVFLGLILIEIALFIIVGGAIGLWLTLAWVLVAGFLGIVVLKGIASLGPLTITQSVGDLTDVLSPLAHRGMVTVAGVLLLFPGFLTDVFAALLLMPPVRRVIMRALGRRFQRSAPPESTVIEGEWKDVSAPPANPPSDPTRH